jgi:hypothetical protein
MSVPLKLSLYMCHCLKLRLVFRLRGFYRFEDDGSALFGIEKKELELLCPVFVATGNWQLSCDSAAII